MARKWEYRNTGKKQKAASTNKEEADKRAERDAEEQDKMDQLAFTDNIRDDDDDDDKPDEEDEFFDALEDENFFD